MKLKWLPDANVKPTWRIPTSKLNDFDNLPMPKLRSRRPQNSVVGEREYSFGEGTRQDQESSPGYHCSPWRYFQITGPIDNRTYAILSRTTTCFKVSIEGSIDSHSKWRKFGRWWNNSYHLLSLADQSSLWSNTEITRSSVETIRMGLGSGPDPPTNHGFHEQPTLSESRRSTSPVRNISASPKFHGIRQLTLLNGLKRIIILFGTRHQRVAASSATYFPIYIHFLMKVHPTLMSSLQLGDHHRPHKPRQLSLSLTIIWTTPIHQTLGHLEDAELQKIKTEGAELSLHIERCLQQQIMAQTHPRTPILADRSHVKYICSISECDAERRRHQEEISLLAEKLIDKEAECKSLKTQNRMSGLQTDLADAKKRIEKLRETVARQNEEISSLKKNWSYLDVFDPPPYEEKAAFSSSAS